MATHPPPQTPEQTVFMCALSDQFQTSISLMISELKYVKYIQVTVASIYIIKIPMFIKRCKKNVCIYTVHKLPSSYPEVKKYKNNIFFLILYEYETRFYTGIKLKMNICLKGEHSN